jgi:steroid 5-alpha reductase family enzyme
MLVYGLRLGIYLVQRDSNETYRRTLSEDQDRDQPVALGVKFAIWITVSILYVVMILPLTNRVARQAAGAIDPAPWLSWIGVATMAFGIAIEAVADRQKDQAKKREPKRFCDRGLYSIVRYPNYFGELLVWTGTLIAGASLLGNWLAWGLSAVGYISIFLIMKGSARRLELKQAERYSRDPAFQTYIEQVPILFPLVPIYSFRNAKIYLG